MIYELRNEELPTSGLLSLTTTTDSFPMFTIGPLANWRPGRRGFDEWLAERVNTEE
jgi:hypothetical protein